MTNDFRNEIEFHFENTFNVELETHIDLFTEEMFYVRKDGEKLTDEQNGFLVGFNKAYEVPKDLRYKVRWIRKLIYQLEESNELLVTLMHGEGVESINDLVYENRTALNQVCKELMISDADKQLVRKMVEIYETNEALRQMDKTYEYKKKRND